MNKPKIEDYDNAGSYEPVYYYCKALEKWGDELEMDLALTNGNVKALNRQVEELKEKKTVLHNHISKLEEIVSFIPKVSMQYINKAIKSNEDSE